MHLILSLKVHSQELPQDPLRGLLENIIPILIKIIKVSINTIERIIVIML